MMHSVAQAARKQLTFSPTLQRVTQQMLQLGVPPDEVARLVQASVDEAIEQEQLRLCSDRSLLWAFCALNKITQKVLGEVLGRKIKKYSGSTRAKNGKVVGDFWVLGRKWKKWSGIFGVVGEIFDFHK